MEDIRGSAQWIPAATITKKSRRRYRRKLWCRVVLAADDCDVQPGYMVEQFLIEGLIRHADAKYDDDFRAECQKRMERREASIPRWEFDVSRRRRPTDPRR
jgi:hypothetical protein